jgi:CHAT domain-containing protein
VAAMVTVAQLQQHALLPGECLLDISTGLKKLFVFAVTRDTLRLAVIDDSDGTIEQRGRRFCGLAGSPAALVVDANVAPTELLADVADILAGATAIVVVSDGWVASLPFAALSLDGGTPLIDTHEISAVPAASLFFDQRVRAPQSPVAGVLAFAPAGGALPGARQEVRDLASRYAGVQPADSLPVASSLADLAQDCGIVHVASHVHVNGERPWHSGIQTGPEGEPGEFLRASEIVRADFRGRLVVLSSCESALGRATQGEGVLGITTAFLGAGARSVVATLWKVDDRTTRQLMRGFYEGREAGMPAGQALRAAQLAIRREYPAPFYWAGFQVVGDARLEASLEPHTRPRILMVSLTLGALALAGVAFAGFRRRFFAPL